MVLKKGSGTPEKAYIGYNLRALKPVLLFCIFTINFFNTNVPKLKVHEYLYKKKRSITYTLSTKSGMMVMIGINTRLSQNTAEVKIISYILVITGPTGIKGQNKL